MSAGGGPQPVSNSGPGGESTPASQTEESTGVTLAQVRAEQRRELFRSPSFIIGAVIVGFWILTAIAPGLFTANGPNTLVEGRLARTGPGADAILGTDKINKSVYSRLIYGSRPVLIMAPAAAMLAVSVGAMLGLVMGYYRGWVDEVLSRLIEGILSLPVILLAILVVVMFGGSRPVIVLTVAGLFAPVVARTIRAAVIGETQLDYVTSAKLRGESGSFIILREILPNISSLFLVEFTVRVGYAIFTIATLRFLGLGVSDGKTADWGSDIARQYDLIQSNQWWPSIFPAIAIASLVIAVNLIADAIEKTYRQ